MTGTLPTSEDDPPGVGGDAQLAVSVVVTVRDGASCLPTLLAALSRQTLPRPRFEVVVVDDASRDDTAAIARRDPETVVISMPTHVGLPAGRNAGIAAARGPLVAFTDADCMPADDWLERGVARFAGSSADILAGGIAMPLGPRPSAAAVVDTSINLDQESYARTGFGAGANLWIRREILDQVGRFDDRLGTYGDEAELCARARAAGATLIYAPDVVIFHPPRARARDLARKSFLQGLALAARRRSRTHEFGGARPLFRQWRAFVPRRRLVPPVRPGEASSSSRRRRSSEIRVLAAHYTLVRVPRLLGDVVGELHHRRRPGEHADRHLVTASSQRELGEPRGLKRRRIR